MSSGFIADGYTRPAFIEAGRDEKSGVEFHPAVKLEYRPMLVSARAVLLRKIGDAANKGPAGVEESEKIAAEAMAKQVKEWSLEGAIDTAGMLRLEQHLSARIFNIVTGFEFGDKQEQADVGNS